VLCLLSLSYLAHVAIVSLGTQGTLQSMKNNLKKLRSRLSPRCPQTGSNSNRSTCGGRNGVPKGGHGGWTHKINGVNGVDGVDGVIVLQSVTQKHREHYSDDEYDYSSRGYKKRPTEEKRILDSLSRVIFELQRRLGRCKQEMPPSPQEEVLYRSQLGYPNGSNMCTPACILFASAVVGIDDMSCPPTAEQMECIMTSASKVQSHLLRLQHGTSYTMFSIKDVVDHIQLPAKYHGIHVVGSIARLPPGFITDFEDEHDNREWVTDLHTAISKLKDNSALILTLRGNAHTVALYRRDARNHWFFDPLVAVVKNFEDANVALFELFKVIRGTEEFTGLMLATQSPQ
jgi:hypothetical protein